MNAIVQPDGLHVNYKILRAFERCPRQFALFREEAVESRQNEDPKLGFIGYLFQAVVGLFYTDELWRRPADVVRELSGAVGRLSRTLTDAYEIPWLPGECERWEQVVLDAIPSIVTCAAEEGLVASSVLQEYELAWTPFPGVTVHGRSDVMLVGDKVISLDLKGGRSYGAYADRFQLLTYGLMAASDPAIGRYPDRSGFWWLRHGKVQWIRSSVKVREAFRLHVLELLRGLAQAYATGVFEALPETTCFRCTKAAQCPEGTAFLQRERSAGGVLPADGTDGCSGVISLE